MINKKNDFKTIDESHLEDELRESGKIMVGDDLQEIAESILSPINNKDEKKNDEMFKDALDDDLNGDMSIDQVT